MRTRSIPNRPHRRVLRRYIRVVRKSTTWQPSTAISVERVWPVVERHLGVGRAVIAGSSRKSQVSEARRALIKLLRDHGWTLEAIASLLNKDHTTIIYHERQAERMVESNHYYASFMRMLAAEVMGDK